MPLRQPLPAAAAARDGQLNSARGAALKGGRRKAKGPAAPRGARGGVKETKVHVGAHVGDVMGPATGDLADALPQLGMQLGHAPLASLSLQLTSMGNAPLLGPLGHPHHMPGGFSSGPTGTGPRGAKPPITNPYQASGGGSSSGAGAAGGLGASRHVGPRGSGSQRSGLEHLDSRVAQVGEGLLGG